MPDRDTTRIFKVHADGSFPVDAVEDHVTAYDLLPAVRAGHAEGARIVMGVLEHQAGLQEADAYAPGGGIGV